jgi:2-dehydro-3-deoxy-D-arabinonate dehydratase
MWHQRRRDGDPRLLATTDWTAYDLTTAKPEVDSFGALAETAHVTDRTFDEVAQPLLDRAETLPVREVETDLRVPLVAEDV